MTNRRTRLQSQTFVRLSALALIVLFAGPTIAQDGSPKSAGKVLPFQVEVRDVDGKPVEGAEVGILAGIRANIADQKTEWKYCVHERSDRAGLVRLNDEEDLSRLCLIARHERRKIAAVASIDPEKIDKPIKLMLVPECEVVGKATCTELADRARSLGPIVVYVRYSGKVMLECLFQEPDFRIPLPPGDYEFEVYGSSTHRVRKSVHVDAQKSVQRIETINLPATSLGLLLGRPAPEIPGIIAWKNGGPVKLADLRGKCVLLEFWRYNCGPCVYSMPEIFELHDKYHDRGLVVVGVHVDIADEEKERVDTVAKLDLRLKDIREKYWKGRDVPFPVGLVVGAPTKFKEHMDAVARSPASATYGVLGYPTQILIDRQGNVVAPFAANEDGINLLEKALQAK